MGDNRAPESKQSGQEAANDEYDETGDEHRDGSLAATLPLLEDDAPEVAERDVQCHKDAEGEGGEDRTLREEALA